MRFPENHEGKGAGPFRRAAALVSEFNIPPVEADQLIEALFDVHIETLRNGPYVFFKAFSGDTDRHRFMIQFADAGKRRTADDPGDLCTNGRKLTFEEFRHHVDGHKHRNFEI